jgi:hypothetical protein
MGGGAEKRRREKNAQSRLRLTFFNTHNCFMHTGYTLMHESVDNLVKEPVLT